MGHQRLKPRGLSKGANNIKLGRCTGEKKMRKGGYVQSVVILYGPDYVCGRTLRCST